MIMNVDDGLPATDHHKYAAYQAVDEFEQQPGESSPFTHISKRDYAVGLRALISDPDAHVQCTNTCGVAAAGIQPAFAYRPLEITQQVITFYRTKDVQDAFSTSSNFNRANRMQWDEGPYKNLKPQPGQNAIDVVLATVYTNMLNTLLPYHPANDSGLSGLTMPGNIRKLAVLNNLVAANGLCSGFDAIKADDTLRQGGTVIILYDTKAVTRRFPSQYFHYIQYRGNFNKTAGTVSMDVWDYGKTSNRTFRYFSYGLWGVWYLLPDK